MGVIDRRESIHGGFSRLRQYAKHSVGRLLGTIAATRSAYKLILELCESRHFHRVEISAISMMLQKKGICTADEFAAAIDSEIKLYETHLANEWPEIKPAADGRSYSLDAKGFARRAKDEGWPP